MRKSLTKQQLSLAGVDELLDGMNAEQVEAITHKDGPLLVLAGAGSGKTRVLIHRVGYLVSQHGVPMERILSVTFSKGAADEMKARGQQVGLVCDFRTWHSLALHILREDSVPIADRKIDDTDRSKVILKEVTGYKGMDWKSVDIGALSSWISYVKNQLWIVDSDEAVEDAERRGLPGAAAVEAFERYEVAMDEAGLWTFDDFLVHVVKHLEGFPGARERWAGRWDYLLQDEAQDANPAQIRIASLLASGHRNYMVVGDPAQSIYGFRGSAPGFLLSFPREWDAKVVTMHRNYRCGSEIIKVANDVIRPSTNRLPVDLVAEGGWEGIVTHRSPASLEDEGYEVAASIEAHVADGGRYGGCAVLYRLNAQSRGIEEALLGSKIPYVVVGGVSFYERKEVKDLLAYLRLSIGEQVRESLQRAINSPFRYLGKAYLEKVNRHKRLIQAHSINEVEAAVMGACSEAGVQARQRASAQEFCRILRKASTIAKPADALNMILQETQYEAWLKRDSGEESLENSHLANVKELVRVASRFGTTRELVEFVDATVESSKRNAEESKGRDRVLLMSIHKSKGLEFEHVNFVGASEQIIPHPRNEDEDEERRLFYVAVTRAKRTLFVTSPRQIATKRGIVQVSLSRFMGVEHSEAPCREVPLIVAMAYQGRRVGVTLNEAMRIAIGDGPDVGYGDSPDGDPFGL